MFKCLTVAAAAACAISATFVTAAAADPRDSSAVKVAVTPAQLRDPASVDRAYARLQRGAYEACNSNSLFDRRTREEDRACAARALDVAVASLAQPLLTARHESQSGARFARGY